MTKTSATTMTHGNHEVVGESAGLGLVEGEIVTVGVGVGLGVGVDVGLTVGEGDDAGIGFPFASLITSDGPGAGNDGLNEFGPRVGGGRPIGVSWVIGGESLERAVIKNDRPRTNKQTANTG